MATSSSRLATVTSGGLVELWSVYAARHLACMLEMIISEHA